MSIKRTELIDAYLRNELNSKETQAFEGELAGDPAFREEVGFQQQVVQGLGEFRKAQLKSRLTAINVSTPWWEVGQVLNPGLVKLTGAIFSAAIVGTGIFYFNNQKDIQDYSNTPTVFLEDLTDTQAAETYTLFEESSRRAPEVITLMETVNSSRSKANLDLEIDSKIKDARSGSADASKREEMVKVGNADDFVPDVALPNPGDGAEKVQFKSESAEIPLASNTDIINASNQIDIKTIQRNNEDIRYKYYEGKLHLYGNFKENPYEILEINSTNNRQVYLFHSNRYYKLLTTDRILDLPQITDRLLIQELEIIRNNKID